MKYVIRKIEDVTRFATGRFVTRQGSQHSYTDKLQYAWIFDTRAQALSEACGNERVLSLEEAVGVP